DVGAVDRFARCRCRRCPPRDCWGQADPLSSAPRRPRV
ncbi:MAG: hypothetical protein AVDCRST_MAG59-2746, partial [uncultured Thermomicrobiales bacterium]